MDSVINIPELFESILLELPFLNLVIATGVNSTFRDFTFSSQKLQRKLFLLPTKQQRSRRQQKHFYKEGVFGPHMKQDACLSFLYRGEPPQVALCPFLLEPSFSPRTAHISTRAAEALSWPRMYLTDPPCAHAHVNFVYHGVTSHGRYVLMEAGRSIYRRGGVTLAAIEEALSQSGTVVVRRGNTSSVQNYRAGEDEDCSNLFLRNTTVAAQIVDCEKRYKCKLGMDLRATTIRLHGSPFISDETTKATIPMAGKYALYGSCARKIRFDN